MSRHSSIGQYEAFLGESFGLSELIFRNESPQEKQLVARIKTLSDFETWSKTKAQRLDVDKIKDMEKQPLINIAQNYGFKNDSYQVLKDFVVRHINRQEKTPADINLNHFQKILNERREERGGSKVDNRQKGISYFRFKQGRHGIESLTSPVRQTIRLKANKSSISHIMATDQGQKSKYIPRELKDLHHRLKSLPAVCKKERTSLPNITASNLDINPQNVGEYSDEVRELTRIVLEEKRIDDLHQLKDTIVDLKKGQLQNFSKKLKLIRDSYKKSVKEYHVCISNYKNAQKRQQVRANGIKRWKKSTLMEKVKKLAKQQEEIKRQQQEQY